MNSVMTFREDTVYVSRRVRRALSYTTDNIDAKVEEVLVDYLKQHHPRVIEHVDRMHNEDKQFREGYKSTVCKEKTMSAYGGESEP
jgi:hypothetical protein